jgi:two-component system, OmpR family, sensor kinase
MTRERTSLLVDDLLPLARLDERRPLDRQPVELDDLVTEAVENAKAVEPERPIELDRLGSIGARAATTFTITLPVVAEDDETSHRR